MAKAALIMNMPECCNKCRFLMQSIRNDFLCICQTAPIPEWMNTKEEYRIIHVNVSAEKPNWCPLLELPKKNPPNPELEPGVYYTEKGYEAYKNGWNACREKFLQPD